MILCHYHYFEFALACVCVTNRRIVKDPMHRGQRPGHLATGQGATQHPGGDLRRPAPGGGAEKRRNGRGTGITPSPASRDSIDLLQAESTL